MLPYVYGKSCIVLTLGTFSAALTLTLLLLFIDPDRDLDAQIMLDAEVYVNGEDIVVPQPWAQYDFLRNIHAALGQDEN